MRKFKFLSIAVASAFSSLIGNAQTRELINQNGVSLSYVRETFKHCDECKCTIYKFIVYLKNNSGHSIRFQSQSSVNIPVGYWAGIGDCGSPYSPSVVFAGGENSTGNFSNNSTSSGVLYMKVPDNEKGIPEPGYNLGPWNTVDDNPKQTKPEPKWSEWITDNCFKGISFRYKKVELYNLNYQLHMYFEIKSSYQENTYFILSLKDERGKEQFGTKRMISPGQTLEAIERMSADMIRSIAVERVTFKNDDGKYVKCDDEREKENADKNNPQNKGKFDNYPNMMPPGEWSILRAPECYGGINYSVRHNGYLKENKGYRWSISFNNYYNAPVTFSYRMIMKNGDDEASEWQYTSLDPTDRNRGGGIYFGGRDVTTSEWDHLEVKEVCFSGTSCKQTGCYAACDIEDKVPNKNCKDGSSPSGKEDAAKKEQQEKEAKASQLKKENDGLIARIQADINLVPAPQTKSQLQNEFDNIRFATTDDETKNSQLKSFETKVNSTAEQIKANKEQFDNDKKQTEENINNIRSQNKEIKKAQTEYMGGWAGFAAAIFSMKGRTGKGSTYQGGSSKISLKMGIQFMGQPVGYNEHTQGSNYYPGTGARTYFNTKEFKDVSILAPGFYFSTEIHPYYSTNFSIGFTGGLSFGYWPEANDGNNDVTSNFAGNSSSTILNFNYGVEVTAGARPVKLLMRYHIHNHQVTTGGITGGTYNGSNYQSEYNTYYDTDQKWKTTWAALGLRFGNYAKSKTFVDVALTRYIPTQVLGLKTVYKNSNLYKADNLKVPIGAYLQVSTQNGIFVRAEYTKDNIIVDDELMRTSVSKKPYFNIVVGRSWEWFGKPYSKKTAAKNKQLNK